ncbi:MAG TPA: BatD family protein, partial [Balneolales bacterium]|nr:BatD family protein [Balneolales bacterium]
PDIYLKMEVSNRHPVVGQQIIANVVIYFRSNLQVISYQPMAGWKAEGFWKEELDDNQQPRAESTIIDGVRYRKAVLMRYALFPSKTTTLQLSPFKVNCTVRYSSDYGDPFSSFFNGFGSDQRSVDLQTDPISVDVKQLPPAPANATALNAVGQFDISRSTDDTQVRVGQSVEIKTVIKGSGNLALISKPKYHFPSAFEVYQPQEQSNIDHNGNRITGTKTFTDVIIPRKIGTFTIPGTRLAYFNDAEQKYQYVDLNPISVNVKANPFAGNLTTSESSDLGIQPLNGLVTWQTEGYRSIFSLWWMWAGLILPLILIGVGYQRKMYLDKLRNDSRFARSTQATSLSDQHLSEAKQAAQKGDLKEAYSKLHQTVSGFIGDRMDLPRAGLEDPVYVKALRDKGVDMDIVKRIERLLTKCSTIRYAPLTSQEDFAQDANAAGELIKSLRKWL